jgi:two-component system chemotaxis response regulator CheY
VSSQPPPTQPPPSPGASAGAASASQPAAELPQLHCLVVEDSPMMRQLLVFALSRVKQLKVTEADDGVDGLRKLAAGKFDIILTDINMPIMDGLKLVKRVRTDAVHKDVPIVVITTESAEEDRQRALSLGANAYITKPIQAPQVIAKVKELLGIEG